VTATGGDRRGHLDLHDPAGDRAVVPAGLAERPRRGTAGQVEDQQLPAAGTQRLGGLGEKDFLVCRVENLAGPIIHHQHVIADRQYGTVAAPACREVVVQ
jgi:hypothetical protein